MVAMETTLRARKLAQTPGWNLLALLLLVGCDNNSPAPVVDEASPRPADAGSLFDPTTAGSVQGRVLWEGKLPGVPLFQAPTSPRTEQRGSELLNWPNPNVPRIHPKTRAVEDAVIYLKGVNPKKARPWDLDPAIVEMRDYQFRILQGKHAKQTGFVRLGDVAEIISRQEVFHAVHANGAAFFSFLYPDPDRTVKRRLNEAGLIELTSAAGYFWMRSYLFVSDHPYITRTDSQGRFDLAKAPPGEYEVVCWLPNWREHHHDRDPETCYWTRLYFREPLEISQKISLANRESKGITFTISEMQFP